MELRRLIESDLESYFANRLRALQNAPSAFLTTFEEEKKRGNAHFKNTLSHLGNDKAIFGAVNEGKIVATIGIFREDRPKLLHKAMIWGMYVDVDYRRGGTGAKLLDLAIHFAKNEMKAASIQLSVESTNHSARKLYESRGFKVWGTEPKAMFFDSQYFNEDHMVLEL